MAGLVAGLLSALVHARVEWLRVGHVDLMLATLSGSAVGLAWMAPGIWALNCIGRVRQPRVSREVSGHAPAQSVDQFETFTERARKVLQYAQEEAQRFHHTYIGTEHLLLGLMREGDGVAAKVLANLGVNLSTLRSSVESMIGRGELPATEIGLTPAAKRIIELAVDEARLLDHHDIGTEHLLLALVRGRGGIAAGVLESRVPCHRRSDLALIGPAR